MDRILHWEVVRVEKKWRHVATLSVPRSLVEARRRSIRMVILRARIPLDCAKREAVRRSLARLVGPIRAMPGCLSCGLFHDVDDPEVLLYVEEWSDMPSLMAHMRTGNMRVILSALDFACRSPEINVLVVRESLGLDFIASNQATFKEN